VRAVSRVEAVMGIIRENHFGNAANIAVESLPYERVFRGPSVKWSVVMKSDGSVLKENFQTPEEADRWMVAHQKAMMR